MFKTVCTAFGLLMLILPIQASPDSKTLNDINTNECADRHYQEALEAITSPRYKGRIQYALQGMASLNSAFYYSLPRVNSIADELSTSPAPFRYTTVYEHSNKGPTEVVFDTKVVNHTVVIALNEQLTLLDGIALSDLKDDKKAASQVSNCLAKALNKAFPKVVAGSGSTAPQ